MAFPEGIIRYAGVWVSTETYVYGMYVVASDNKPYGCGVGSDVGTDPATQPSAVWFPFPPPGGGWVGDITEVIAGTGLTGGGDTGAVTLANDGVLELTAGTNVVITGTKANYTIAASGSGGGIVGVAAGEGIAVDNTNPLLPSVSNAGVVTLNDLTGGLSFITAGDGLSLAVADPELTLTNTGVTSLSIDGTPLTGNLLFLYNDNGLGMTLGDSQFTLANTGVTSLNGLTADLSIASGAGTSVSVGSGTVTVSNTGVTSLNGQTGDTSIINGNGTAVQLVGGSVAVDNTGILSLNGLTANVSIASGTGTSISVGSGTVTINNAGVTSVNTLTGGLTLAAGSGISVTPSGGNTLTVASTGATFFVESYDIYVAPNGNDTTGTGSQQNPYQTIGKAILARSAILNTIEVSIRLASGTYTESIILVRNTYLVGVPTGEAKQPVNVNGLITMSDTTGNIGIANIDVQGAVTAIAGVGGTTVFSIFATNILPVSPVAGNSAVSLSNGTMYITETRITGGTSQSNAEISNSLGALYMRDVVIDGSLAATGLVSNSNTITSLRQCYFTSTSASTSVNPLVKFGGPSGAVVQTIEIFDCKFVYTSSAVDTVGNKCCIQMAGLTGTQNIDIAGCLLICEGATTAVGGQIQCIQKINAGVCNMKYGNLLAGATANHISPTIVKTAYIAVS